MRFTERKIDGLLRGMILAVILVAAASVRRLQTGNAAVRPPAQDALLASGDGRFTLEAECSLFDAAPAQAGELTMDSEVEAVDCAILAGEGFELSSAIEESAEAMTPGSDMIIPVEHGGIYECEGDLVLAPESSVWIGIGADIEMIAAGGGVQLGGLLVIDCLRDFFPAVGDGYTIIAGDSMTGDFDSIQWRGWPEHLQPRIEVRPDEVVVIVE